MVMKTFIIFSLLLILVLSGNAQKINRETLQHGITHVPERLIYDQIKSYGVKANVVPSNGFNMDYTFATNAAGVFTAYSKMPYENADMQLQVNYGPYTALEEKSTSRAVSEEVNKVRTSYTYFKRILKFKFPVTYSLINRKNGVRLYYNEYSENNIRSIESPEFKTEQEALNSFNQGRLGGLQNDINTFVQSFCNSSNAAARDMYDFYPTGTYMSIFQFKKWEKDDEYNDHIKHVIKTFAVLTADENAGAYIERIKDDINYFKQFEGVFKPDDKKEDILYFGNYYNLATIYNALDDFEKADYFLKKLDSSDKEKTYTKSLKNIVEQNKRRTARHFISTLHLNYNPVNDYRLANKNVVSDAMSSSEAMAQSVTTGTITSADEAITSEGKTLKGKVFFDKENSQLKIIPSDKSEQVLLTPSNTSSLNVDGLLYTVAKANIDGALQKNFFRVEYKSDKIQLLQLMKNDLTASPDYIGLLRPKEDLVNILLGLSVKKNMAKYFSDCEVISDMAKEGSYGGSIYGGGGKDRLGKFIEMCKEYTACKK